jgi:hypothetical protein
MVSSLTSRGFGGKPMFPDLVFAPPVTVDLGGPNTPTAVRAAVIEELVRRTLEQDEN